MLTVLALITGFSLFDALVGGGGLKSVHHSAALYLGCETSPNLPKAQIHWHWMEAQMALKSFCFENPSGLSLMFEVSFALPCCEMRTNVFNLALSRHENVERKQSEVSLWH